jgi:hypothetical protein
MPCFLRLIPREIKEKIKSKDKIPTKEETKATLEQEYNAGKITYGQYYEWCQAVDACVEEPGHTHEHDEEHEHVHAGE